MWHTREKLGTSCFCFLRENRMSPAAFPFRKLSPLLWGFALPSTLPPRRNVNATSSLYRKCDFIYANKTDGSRKGEMRDSGCRSTRIHQRACRCVIPTSFFSFFLSARQQLNLAEKQHLTNKGFLCNIYFLKLLSFYHFFFNLTVTNRKTKSLSFCTSFILHLCLFIYLFNFIACFHLMSNFVPWKESLFIACKTDLFMFSYICLQYISVVHTKRLRRFCCCFLFSFCFYIITM